MPELVPAGVRPCDVCGRSQAFSTLRVGQIFRRGGRWWMKKSASTAVIADSISSERARFGPATVVRVLGGEYVDKRQLPGVGEMRGLTFDQFMRQSAGLE